VETEALRDTATAFNKYADQLRDDVKTQLTRCSLPSSSIPVPDMGFAATYAGAYSDVDRACVGSADVFTAMGNALVRVANHYEGQDQENARAFGGNPIPAPTFPATGDQMSEQLSTSEAITAGIGYPVLVAAIMGATAALMAAEKRVPAWIVFVSAVPALAMIKDPVPYFDAHGAGAAWTACVEAIKAARIKAMTEFKDQVGPPPADLMADPLARLRRAGY
jgi:uncharacterized protein YukE